MSHIKEFTRDRRSMKERRSQEMKEVSLPKRSLFNSGIRKGSTIVRRSSSSFLDAITSPKQRVKKKKKRRETRVHITTIFRRKK